MSITTFSELKSTIADWLARDDLTSNIPDFIKLAEASLNRTLHHAGMETRSTVTVDLTSTEPEFITLPTDFQSMRRIRVSSVDGKPELTFKSEQQLNEYRNGISNTTGQPFFYTIFGTEIELAPTPDSAYTIEMVYRQKLTALSDTDTSNWLLALAPDVYLYGALLQSAPFTHDADKIVMWGAAYQAALTELEKHGRSLKYGPTPSITLPETQATP